MNLWFLYFRDGSLCSVSLKLCEPFDIERHQPAGASKNKTTSEKKSWCTPSREISVMSAYHQGPGTAASTEGNSRKLVFLISSTNVAFNTYICCRKYVNKMNANGAGIYTWRYPCLLNDAWRSPILGDSFLFPCWKHAFLFDVPL